MGRSPCCSKVGLRRGPWSTKEDALLTNFIQLNGEGQWRSLPKKAGLLRCGKSCRLRWMNYLRPGIVRGNITDDEEDLIVRLHSLLGNRWSLIAGRLPGRTDNEIKNYWNTHLQKKLKHSKTIQKEFPNHSGKKVKSKEAMNKVYLPKPIRVSPSFSRTSSYDSLLSSDGSTKVAEEVSVWPPLTEEDFLIGGFILPTLDHSNSISSDIMLDKVYDEYLQLL